ncbi:MAG: efflux RND transporter permease subunit, partial [Thermoguttaceae bacterium]
MNFLASICVRRPVFATVLTLVFLVFGVVGYMNLGLDRFPKIDFPIITVTTRLPGSASEEVETEITDKIEEAVNTTSGIDELRSVSSEGISQVFITFVLEKDADIAAQEVRDKVNRILSDLPKDIEQPFVEKFDPDSMPVMSIAVSSPSSIRDLTEYCDKVLRRQLESLSGVGQVLIVGGQKRQINVHLDGLKMRSHRLTVADVAKALQSQNLQVPGGTVKAGQLEFTLRTMGRVTSMAEIEQITVKNSGGHTITIGDLGHVEDGAEEIKSLARYNDTPAVLLNIRKQSGTNTIEVARLLKERLAELQKSTPQDHRITIVRDQSPFIQAAVDTVKEHLVLGGLLAAVVIYFFLANIRTTVIAALAIPTSIISAFSVVYFMGFTLNSITLLALALSVGIVIDDAIVVLENIYRYIEEKGCTAREAAFAATKEIGLAVLSITLSLVAVFLPIAFMGGIVGRFLKSFGITMSATILVSMIISFSLTPMLAARWLRRKDEGGGIRDEGKEEDNLHPSPDQPSVGARRGAGGEGLLVPLVPPPKAASRGGAYAWIEGGYMALLRLALRFRWVVVLFVVGMLAMVPTLMSHVRKNFLPDDDQSEFEVKVRTPEGTSLEATFVVLDRIAREVRNLGGVEYTLTSVADDDQRIANAGTVYVRMAPLGQR